MSSSNNSNSGCGCSQSMLLTGLVILTLMGMLVLPPKATTGTDASNNNAMPGLNLGGIMDKIYTCINTDACTFDVGTGVDQPSAP